MKLRKISLNENRMSQHEKAMADYHKYAHNEGAVTNENLDEWALNEASCKNAVTSADLKHLLLGEDVTVGQAARQLDADVSAAESKSKIEAVLDKALKVALRKNAQHAKSDFPNVLLIGEAGTGKTDIVRQWANENNINLVEKNAGTMNPTDLGGIVARDSDDANYAKKLGTKEMDALDQPRSVLFLDEYNRSKTEVRGSLLTLVQNHIVLDPREEDNGGKRYLSNFLFTIAAINPSGSSYGGAKEMDPAELSRFKTFRVQMNPGEHLRYLQKVYEKEIENAETEEEKMEAMGRLKLAETILLDSRFEYDTAEITDDHRDDSSYRPLNYRSFKLLLDWCDGTKEDFLDNWDSYCNYEKKHDIEDILENYEDIEDEANDALKGGTTSDVFASKKSLFDLLNDKFNLEG